MILFEKMFLLFCGCILAWAGESKVESIVFDKEWAGFLLIAIGEVVVAIGVVVQVLANIDFRMELVAGLLFLAFFFYLTFADPKRCGCFGDSFGIRSSYLRTFDLLAGISLLTSWFVKFNGNQVKRVRLVSLPLKAVSIVFLVVALQGQQSTQQLFDLTVFHGKDLPFTAESISSQQLWSGSWEALIATPECDSCIAATEIFFGREVAESDFLSNRSNYLLAKRSNVDNDFLVLRIINPDNFLVRAPVHFSIEDGQITDTGISFFNL